MHSRVHHQTYHPVLPPAVKPLTDDFKQITTCLTTGLALDLPELEFRESGHLHSTLERGMMNNQKRAGE
jgi:hypothetical protein